MITKNNRKFSDVRDRTTNIIPLVLAITISSTSVSVAQQQIELIPVQDCVTSQLQPDTNLNGDGLTIGVADNYYYVSLVQFDISSLPDCARIKWATLSLDCNLDQNMGTAKLLELADSWNETTVTFNNMPYGNADGPSYYFDVSTGWNSTDVTESVVTWYNGTRPNYGFQIKPNDFVNGQLAMFYPRESGTNVAPKLTINYSFVLPGTPTASANNGLNAGEIQLAWSLVSCATGYQILYDEDADNPPFDPSQDGNPSSGSRIGNESYVTITGLTPGQLYYLAVRAYNDYYYGYYSNIVTATATAAASNTPPSVSITSGPTGTITVNSATFTWTGSDPDGTISKYYYELDDSTPDNSTTSTSHTFTNLSNGSHTFYVQAEDNDGAKSSVASRSFTVNVTVNQSPTVNTTISDRALGIGQIFTLNLEDPDSTVFVDADGDNLTYTANSSNTSIATASISGTSLTVTGVSHGMATVTVKADDGNGGTALTSFAVSVDSTRAGVDLDIGLPSEFVLYPAYPNPFNPSTTIEFSIPKSGWVTINAYGISGREVITIINQYMDVGHHTVQWNASDVPSGTYFVKMQSGSFSQVRKVMVLK